MLWLFALYIFSFYISSSTEKHFLSWLFLLSICCFLSSSQERIVSWLLFTPSVSFFLLFRTLSAVALMRSGFYVVFGIYPSKWAWNESKWAERGCFKKIDVLLACIWQVGKLNWLILFLFLYRFVEYLRLFINEDTVLRWKLLRICPTGPIQPIKQGFSPNRSC